MKQPPSRRTALREEKVLPLMDAFFAWAKAEAKHQQARNVASTALGYAVNQEVELRAVLKNHKLPLDNTRSERALRKIIIGRNYAESWIMGATFTQRVPRRSLR